MPLSVIQRCVRWCESLSLILDGTQTWRAKQLWWRTKRCHLDDGCWLGFPRETKQLCSFSPICNGKKLLNRTISLLPEIFSWAIACCRSESKTFVIRSLIKTQTRALIQFAQMLLWWVSQRILSKSLLVQFRQTMFLACAKFSSAERPACFLPLDLQHVVSSPDIGNYRKPSLVWTWPCQSESLAPFPYAVIFPLTQNHYLFAQEAHFSGSVWLTITVTRIPMLLIKECPIFCTKSNCNYHFNRKCSTIYISRTEKQLRDRITKHPDVVLEGNGNWLHATHVSSSNSNNKHYSVG